VRGLAAWCREELDAHKIAAAGSAIAIAMRSASERSNYASAIELGRFADAGLSLSGRWGLWSGVLDEVSSASAHAGDLFTDAWLLHQLGSRSLVTGDAAAAGDMLYQAADIRRQIGDTEGLEVTEHNLRFLPPNRPVVLPVAPIGILVGLWRIVVDRIAIVILLLLLLVLLVTTCPLVTTSPGGECVEVVLAGPPLMAVADTVSEPISCATTPTSITVTLEAGAKHVDADFGMTSAMPNSGTAISCRMAILGIAILLLLVVIEVLITVTTREYQGIIFTLPLSSV
jgi:hypothetical protein